MLTPPHARSTPFPEPDANFRLTHGLLVAATAFLPLSAALALWGFGVGLTTTAFWLCMAGGLLFSARHLSAKSALTLLCAALPIFLLHSISVDPSYDGRTYHLPISIELANDLNLFLDQSQSPWGNIYPSGSWRLRAALSTVGIGLHSGLFLNVALAVASYIVTEFATRGLVADAERWRKFLCAAAAASPVVLAQISTSLVDGIVGSLHLILVMTGYLMARDLRPIYLALFLAVGIFLISTKTSGIFFFGITTLATGAALLVRSGEKRWSTLVYLSVWLLVTLSLTVVANYRPIATNIQTTGSPLPDTGPIMSGNIPADLEGRTRAYQFMAGIFSRVGGNVCCSEPLEWKLPGTFNIAEFRNAKEGPRTGGFGPLYGLVLLVGIASLVNLKTQSGQNWLFAAMVGTAAIGCAMFPEPWWGRYIPFIGSLAPLLLIGSGWKPRIWQQALIAAAIGLNGLAFIANTVNTNITYHQGVAKLRSLASSNDILIDAGGRATFLENYMRHVGLAVTLGACPDPDHYFVGHAVCTRPKAKR